MFVDKRFEISNCELIREMESLIKLMKFNNCDLNGVRTFCVHLSFTLINTGL
jgi:hypothetical protein